MRFLIFPILLLAGVVIRRYAGEAFADRLRAAIVRLVINLGMPLLILATIWTRSGAAVDWAWGLYVITFMLMLALSVFMSRLIPMFEHFPLSVPFPNLTYLGIPVLWTLLGPDAITLAIIFDYLCGTPATFLVAGWLARNRQNNDRTNSSTARQSTLTALLFDWAKLPPLWALAIGLIIPQSLFAGTLAEVLQFSKVILGWTIGPVMILAVGLAIRWKAIGHSSLWLASILRLLLAPAIAVAVILAARAMSIADNLPIWKLQAVVLEHAMPTMVLAGIMAIRIDYEPERVTGAVALSSILSIITIPAWWWTLKYIF